uniref:imidazolonepropionase n=1 Tax=Globodera pallida TaxID=36090 RepID=A0A183C4M3_GLOPA
MLVLHNIGQIVQVVDDDRTCCLLGDQMGNIKIMESDRLDLAILCNEGRIVQIGTIEEISPRFGSTELKDSVSLVDCRGGSVLPGFVDAHSHPVFSGDRVHEFAMKLAGASYMEVQEAGGGIHYSTEKTREATEEQLLQAFLEIAQEMLSSGTTLLEAKSGYGLELGTELKQLRVLERAQAHTPLEIAATFCGAHAIPRGATERSQTELIVNEMIPAIDVLRRAGKLKNTENVDVFCEKGVFELDSTRRILEAGKAIGLNANFHADELFPLGGAELGAAIGVIPHRGWYGMHFFLGVL